MPSFNKDDVDFDLGNLRLEEDSWMRMIRENNGYAVQDNAGVIVPIDGDKLVFEKIDDPKITQTLAMFYNNDFSKK